MKLGKGKNVIANYFDLKFEKWLSLYCYYNILSNHILIMVQPNSFRHTIRLSIKILKAESHAECLSYLSKLKLMGQLLPLISNQKIIWTSSIKLFFSSESTFYSKTTKFEDLAIRSQFTFSYFSPISSKQSTKCIKYLIKEKMNPMQKKD